AGSAVLVAVGARLKVGVTGAGVAGSAVMVAGAGSVTDIGVSLAQPVSTHSQATARSSGEHRDFTGAWNAENLAGQA
ncbi:MAG: hypothetical protein ABI847_09810, partial [Anaerolineales bacterium]